MIAEQAWGETASEWATLPYHPSILDAIAFTDGAPWIRYVELDAPGPADGRDVASWFLDTCLAVQHARHHATEPRLFANPVLGVDAERRAHVGFLPHDAGDPGPRALIARIAEILLVGGSSGGLRSIVRDARQARFDSFAAVIRRLSQSAAVPERAPNQVTAWRRYERSRGFAALGDHVSAAAELELAMLADPALRPGRFAAASQPERATELEAARRFAEARDLYARDTSVDGRLGLARCELALGRLDEAIAIVRAIDSPAAAWIEATARSRSGDHTGALEAASRLPDDDAAVWYLRGKALLALRKHADARAALDRACALAPGHTAAQILRVEVIRAAARLYRELGRDPPAPAPTGPHADATARVLAGDVDGAIDLLRGRDDRDARLMLASCLAFRARHDDALLLYDALDGRPAALGRAGCLLAVGRAEDALAAYDAVLAGDAYDVDALDGRARALDRLGRADADAAHRRTTAIALSHT